MVPKFCKGCGRRLDLLDRDYCPSIGCQDKARAEKRGGLLLGPGWTKAELSERIDRCLMACSSSGRNPDAALTDSLVTLRSEVRTHSWDECSALVTKLDELLAHHAANRRKPIVVHVPNGTSEDEVRELVRSIDEIPPTDFYTMKTQELDALPEGARQILSGIVHMGSLPRLVCDDASFVLLRDGRWIEGWDGVRPDGEVRLNSARREMVVQKFKGKWVGDAYITLVGGIPPRGQSTIKKFAGSRGAEGFAYLIVAEECLKRGLLVYEVRLGLSSHILPKFSEFTAGKLVARIPLSAGLQLGEEVAIELENSSVRCEAFVGALQYQRASS